MKTLQRNFISTFLAIACGMVLLTNIVHAKDDAPPPEVKAIIGMKIMPETGAAKRTYIPNFILFGGGMLRRQIGNESPKAELVFEEGIVGEKWPVFIVYAIHADKTREILDARLLPRKLINWRYVNGKIEWLEHSDRLIFSTDCLYAKGDGRIIFGLEDPKVERKGFSTRIERAWEIDQQSGHIKSIPTRNITCAILGE